MTSQPIYDPCLDQVVEAILATERDQACNYIVESSKETKLPIETLLLHAWTCPSLVEAEELLQQALELNSSNELALAGLTWTKGIREFSEQQQELKTQADEGKRLEAYEKALAASQEKERLEAEAKEEARLETEEQERLAAEEEAQLEAEEKERLAAEEEEAEEKARLEIEEQERLAAEEEARLETEEKERLAAEEEEAEEQARLEAEEKEQQESSDDGQTDDAKLDESDSEEQQADKIMQEVQSLSGAVQSIPAAVVAKVAEVGGSEEEAGDAKKPVILAVDDSPTVRKLVALTLTRAGFEVIEAENGVEALNILASTRPDVVLSDINMPKLNGYKLCKFVKKHERTSDIPVIMLSGKDGVFDKMRGKLCGCDDFLSKPFEASALVAKVREYCSTGVANA